MRPINFFEDPLEPEGKSRADVRLKNLGLYVYEDGRRIAVGFDMTPFSEKPSIEVTVTNARGEVAGSMTVIEAFKPNFHLTLHLRDEVPTDHYELEAVLYYGSADEEKLVVDRKKGAFDLTQPGDQTVWAEGPGEGES